MSTLKQNVAALIATKNSKKIGAFGEISGHSHDIHHNEGELVMEEGTYVAGKPFRAKLAPGAKPFIVHEEHFLQEFANPTIEEKEISITHQQEEDPYNKIRRTVLD